MKRIAATLLILCLAFNAWAVDVTITLTAPQLARAVHELGLTLNLRDGSNNPRDATNAELKAWTIDQVRKMVQLSERATSLNAVVVVAFDPT